MLKSENIKKFSLWAREILFNNLTVTELNRLETKLIIFHTKLSCTYDSQQISFNLLQCSNHAL